ncbi:MAG: hypothetical protein KF730_08570 [Sphingomonas sp.]|uniref:hypothetical protein n=1 Tax=Sphingomonas sp. TaxID=28214 RepID=UPI0025D4E759|nr:hypothetical protein [Sphingomonas sp.]MBX3564613.1 hypothetical protein [Sphingomonas sp.]
MVFYAISLIEALLVISGQRCNDMQYAYREAGSNKANQTKLLNTLVANSSVAYVRDCLKIAVPVSSRTHDPKREEALFLTGKLAKAPRASQPTGRRRSIVVNRLAPLPSARRPTAPPIPEPPSRSVEIAERIPVAMVIFQPEVANCSDPLGGWLAGGESKNHDRFTFSGGAPDITTVGSNVVPAVGDRLTFSSRSAWLMQRNLPCLPTIQNCNARELYGSFIVTARLIVSSGNAGGRSWQFCLKPERSVLS